MREYKEIVSKLFADDFFMSYRFMNSIYFPMQ